MFDEMGMSPETRVYTAWLVVHRAEDLPGQWVAHCLDFDLVTQGDSMHQAVEMSCDAIGMVVADDAARGLDPHARRAPQKYWTTFYDWFSKCNPVRGGIRSVREEDVGLLITQVNVTFVFSRTDHERAPKEIGCETPIVLETGRRDSLRSLPCA
jgi:hypothetical protein